MSQLYCIIRNEWVAAQPEEKVRQKLLLFMIEHLGFSRASIALERGLSQMPHLSLLDGRHIPDRRADIICFGKGIHPDHDLYPLLLIECKAVKLTPKVVNQVSGYNHFLNAYFIAIANQDEVRTGWYDAASKTYLFVDYLPTYSDLLKKAKHR